MQGTLRSTLSANLVNELRIGRSGGATLFSPEIGLSQFQGTSVADQAGFLLDINGDFLGITNAHSTGSYSGREAGTKIAENTLNWLKGSHSVQLGVSFTQADVWVENQQRVPTLTFGVDSNDPANGMFTTGNFANASTAQLNDARELYATLVGRINGINGELRLIRRRRECLHHGPQQLRAEHRPRLDARGPRRPWAHRTRAGRQRAARWLHTGLRTARNGGLPDRSGDSHLSTSQEQEVRRKLLVSS